MTFKKDEILNIEPINQTLYPALSKPSEALQLAFDSLPMQDKNLVYSLIITYHNTLLAAMENQ